MEIRKRTANAIRLPRKLLIFALPGGLGFLFAFYRRLLVCFSLSDFREDARASALTFKASESAVQRLIFFDMNFCHYLISLLRLKGRS